MAFELELDEFYRFADLLEDDEETGLATLRRRAEAGDKTAIAYLGVYLCTELDRDEEAMVWLKQANLFGYSLAAWNLAMIARARGLLDEMRQWIDRAAALGCQDALAAQSNGYDVDAVLANW